MTDATFHLLPRLLVTVIAGSGEEIWSFYINEKGKEYIK